MKAGVAVMIKTILDERENVVGVFYTGEEGTPEQNGLNNLMGKLKEDFSIELAIVMEPSSFCLLYTSPSPRDGTSSRMPSSA